MGLFSRKNSNSNGGGNGDIYAGDKKGSICSKFLNILGIVSSFTVLVVGLSILFSFGMNEEEEDPDINGLQTFLNLLLAVMYIAAGVFGIFLELKRSEAVSVWLKMMTTFKGRALWFMMFGLLIMNPNPDDEPDDENDFQFPFSGNAFAFAMLFCTSVIFFISSLFLDVECSVLLD